jgi:hypothetical protein
MGEEHLMSNYSDLEYYHICIVIQMNFPAASRGVSMNDNFYPDEASCGELYPADFAISTTHSL